MVKKKVVPTEPTISEIPIPVSDNPMVIDLPDGQKIVLGKLNPGSVIEVATWRGTGRPDSRTNRFMLGVSDSPAIANTQTPQSSSTKTSINKLQALWKRQKVAEQVSDQSAATYSQEKKNPMGFISKFVGGTVESVSNALKRTRDLTPIETTQDLDINAWIQNISREAEIKSARKTARAAASKKAATPKKAAASKKSVSKKRK